MSVEPPFPICLHSRIDKKYIERPVIIGNKVGTICGRELKINLKNTVAGNPLLTINSIN